MRKTICAVALVVASIGIGAPTAYADTPRCVTKAEYRRVHDGMRRARVHRIFDTRGHRDAIAGSGPTLTEVRGYRTCRRGSAVSVSYRNRRVTAKFAVWRRG
jgi:Ni/Co efflux regulator RcnB